MAAVLKVLAVAFVALAGAGVSAETHHVVSGGPDFNVTAWLLGRLFTVGDKLRFEYSEKIVEVGGAEELATCNLTNPIRMLTDPVALEEEGVRYFTTGDPESCRKGLKLPITVHNFDHPDVPSPPHHPDVPSPPYHPDLPSPPYHPDVHSPPHHPDVPSPPYKPDVPSPPYEPYKPDVPSPPHKPPPSPSAAARLNGGLCLLLAAAYCLAM